MHSLGVVDQIDGRVELKIPCQKPKFPNYKNCTIIPDCETWPKYL